MTVWKKSSVHVVTFIIGVCNEWREISKSAINYENFNTAAVCRGAGDRVSSRRLIRLIPSTELVNQKVGFG